MSTKEGKDSNSQDGTLFRQAMRDVQPIKDANRIATPQKEARRTKRLQPDLAEPKVPAVGFGDRLRFRRNPVSKARMRALAAGKIRIEAGIDLHGLTADKAQRELHDFLAECLARRLRCIRVVHGKGFNSRDHGPVLKAMTDRYLRSVADVLAFSSAPDSDGGTGATYVLLDTGD